MTPRPRAPFIGALVLCALVAGATQLTGCELRLGTTTPWSTSRDAVVGETTTVRISKVIDGDTIGVEALGGRDLGRVRLLGIDAPEIAHRARPSDECYGREAEDLLARLAPPGTRVTLTRDLGQDDRDVYGRLLRYLDRDGSDIAEAILAAGAAKQYDSTPPLGRARRHHAAAQTARDHLRGLWETC